MKNVMQEERTTRGCPRRSLINVRILPRVLDQLSSCLRSFQHSNEETAGLLFGTVDEGFATVEALIRFPVDHSIEGGLTKGERLGRGFDEFVLKSKLRHELAPLELVGWWCLRGVEDIRFLKEEATFHTLRFRRISDILLVLRSDGAETGSASLYARSGDRPLSAEDHQFAALSFHRDTPSAEAQSLMFLSSWVNSQGYLDVYQVLKKIDVADKSLWPPRIASWGIWQRFTQAKLPSEARWQLPKRWMSEAVSALAKVPSRLSIFKSTAPPNAIRPITSARTSKIPLLVALVVLLWGSSLSIAFVHFRGASLHLPYVTSLQAPRTGLHLRLEIQGEGILVSWDRDTQAVRSAKNGVLHIADGSQKHTAELEHNELANGSLFYKPAATDLDFELTVYGTDGSTLTDGVRVIDHSKHLTMVHSATVPFAPGATKTDTSKSKLPMPAVEEGRAKLTNPEPVQKRVQAPPPVRSAAVTSRPAETKNLLRETPRAQALSATANVPQPAVAGGLPDRMPAARATTLQAFVSPRPIKTVMLNGALFESSLLDGIRQVEVVVDIDEDGRVTAARSLSTNEDVSPLVAAAAVTAAKQWVFEPARIGSNNVAAKHTIVFRFAQR